MSDARTLFSSNRLQLEKKVGRSGKTYEVLVLSPIVIPNFGLRRLLESPEEPLYL